MRMKILAFVFLLAASLAFGAPKESAEIVVVGGTPSGIAAALTAARLGHRVILIESRPYLGSPLTSAMLNTFDMDRWKLERSTVQGIFAEFYRALGLTFDPVAARKYFLEVVREEPLITLELDTEFTGAVLSGNALRGIEVSRGGRRWEIGARVVIDCTDDADVAAASGVPFDIGRETSGIDDAMQPASLLFRLKNFDWGKVLDYIEERNVPRDSGGIDDGYAWGYSTIIREYRSGDPDVEALDLNVGRDPDGTAWINSLQIFGVDGTDAASREKGYERGERAVQSFVKFLNENAPGFEGAELAGIAPELYIRETRHIHGLYVLTAQDILNERVFGDRIAVASYPIDLHPYKPGEENPFKAERHPYTIPIRSIIASRVDNLFVASRSLSATYEAAGSARVVPTTVALGQAAGAAASVCVENNVNAWSLAKNRAMVTTVQKRLRDGGVQLYL